MIEKKKVAILGANGQIGSVIAKNLNLMPDIQLIAVCRNFAGAQLLRDIACEVRIGSVDESNFDPKILEDCEVVINCIWPAGSSQAVEKINSIILDNVAKQPHNQKFISLSSVAVYGTCIDQAWSTFDKPKPDGPYGQSKLEFERLIIKKFQKIRKSFYIIRLGHVFGAEQWLSSFILSAISDPEMLLPFSGNLPSNAIHVNDVTRGIISLIQSPPDSGIYNLASNPQLSWDKIFEWHSKVCQLPLVGSMNYERSLRLRQFGTQDSRLSPLQKGFRSLRGIRQAISFGWLLGSPEFKYLGNIILSIFPERISKRLKAISAMQGIRHQILALNNEKLVSPLFLCDAMPGKYLSIPKLNFLDEKDDLRDEKLYAFYRLAILGEE